MRWISSLVIAIILLVSGCGGNGGLMPEPEPESSGATQDGDLRVEIDAEVMRVARTIVDRLGPGRAFDAVALALDAGYGVDQISDRASELTADGTIPGLDPSGSRSGLFALRFGRDGTPILAAPADLVLADGDDLEFLRDRFRVAASIGGGEDEEEISTFMVGALMQLVAVGYSVDQIVEGIVLREVRLTSWNPYSWNDFACFALAADDGTLVAPELVPPAWEVWKDATRCHERIWEGDTGFFVGCENDAYGICTEGEAVAGSTTTNQVGEPAAAGPGDLAVFDGTYAGDVILGPDTDLSWAMAWEMTSASSNVTITDGMVEGTAATHVIFTQGSDENLAPCRGGEGCAVKTQSVVQTMPFNGAIDEAGVIIATGTSATVYTLISCVSDPEELCLGAQPTTSGDPFPITVEGVVEADGTLTFALIWNGDSIRYLGEASR